MFFAGKLKLMPKDLPTSGSAVKAKPEAKPPSLPHGKQKVEVTRSQLGVSFRLGDSLLFFSAENSGELGSSLSRAAESSHARGFTWREQERSSVQAWFCIVFWCEERPGSSCCQH